MLVDTNAIIEAHRTGVWAGLAGAYGVETVEDCVAETQAGYHRRPQEQRINIGDLQSSLAAVHGVADRERAELALRVRDIALDRGEESLWAHALGRAGSWFLCGPDRASLRVGVRLRFRERLVSLEELLDRAGHRPRRALKPAYTSKWMRRVVSEMVVAEIGAESGR